MGVTTASRQMIYHLLSPVFETEKSAAGRRGFQKNKSAIWSNELSLRVVPNYIPTPQESDETVSGTSV
jgi:hypothetical protein